MTNFECIKNMNIEDMTTLLFAFSKLTVCAALGISEVEALSRFEDDWKEIEKWLKSEADEAMV